MQTGQQSAFTTPASGKIRPNWKEADETVLELNVCVCVCGSVWPEQMATTNGARLYWLLAILFARLAFGHISRRAHTDEADEENEKEESNQWMHPFLRSPGLIMRFFFFGFFVVKLALFFCLPRFYFL